MQVWALGCLHLFGDAGENPMEKYGERWRNHPERIAESCKTLVGTDDLLLLPGDLSLVNTFQEALPDLAFIAALPGQKVMIKGNHDFWWTGVDKVRKALPERVAAIQYDAFVCDNIAIAGTRGWANEDLSFKGFLPERVGSKEEDRKAKWDSQRDNRKIYNREVGRLRSSLERLPDKAGIRIAMLHYPPTNHLMEATPMTELLECFGVQHCVFAHLHGNGLITCRQPFGERGGVQYHLVSSDFVGFSPQLIVPDR